MNLRQLSVSILAVVTIAAAVSIVLGLQTDTIPTVTPVPSTQAQAGTVGSALVWSPLRLAAAITAAVTMLAGLWLVFSRLKAKNQGFGPNALKALGLVLFLPTLVIVAVAVPNFNTETLAALLGTVAGYVLSHSKAEDN
jgi:hypothetical protein